MFHCQFNSSIHLRTVDYHLDISIAIFGITWCWSWPQLLVEVTANAGGWCCSRPASILMWWYQKYVRYPWSSNQRWCRSLLQTNWHHGSPLTSIHAAANLHCGLLRGCELSLTCLSRLIYFYRSNPAEEASTPSSVAETYAFANSLKILL